MPLKVLISGGGIAGPALAHHLSRIPPSHPFYPVSTTIVERAQNPRTTGQAVDIRGPGVPIMNHMGIESKVRDKNTLEEGFQFVDSSGKVRAEFKATGDTEKQGFTSEYEILRGDLAEILLNDIENRKGIQLVYGETIAKLTQLKGDGQEVAHSDIKDGDKHTNVRVEYSNGRPAETFDLVVLADGLMSRSRTMVFGTTRADNGAEFVNPLGQYCAFFTIPIEPSDTGMAQWCAFPRGRMELTRPDRYGERRAFLAVTDDPKSPRFDKFHKASREGLEEQLRVWREEFEGLTWQTERLLEGMKDAKDFYFSMTAQVKMDNLVKGSVACLGDTGYCPSPISGMGTTSALVGGYILATSLLHIDSVDSIPAALKDYQTTMRPYLDEVQKLAPGAPQVANPQSEWGIKLTLFVAGLASKPWAQKFFSALGPAFGKKGWTLPKDPKEEAWAEL